MCTMIGQQRPHAGPVSGLAALVQEQLIAKSPAYVQAGLCVHTEHTLPNDAVYSMRCEKADSNC